MSDFLDRLATRAIGGEGLLMPRLPSLFEPLAGASAGPSTTAAFDAPVRAGSMLPVAEAIAGEHVRAASPVAEPATPARPNAHATMADAPSALTQPPAPSATPATTVARRPPRTESLLPSPRMRDRADRALRPAIKGRHDASVTSSDPIAPSPPVQRGVLLPPPSPVFASSRASSQPAEPGRGSAAARSRHVLADRPVAVPSEPVVHVSIGRLEVRATASSPAPPRRRDEPRPDSLDDYLRKRGKASP